MKAEAMTDFKHDKKFWCLWFSLICLAAALALVFLLVGCESQSAKQQEKLAQIHEVAVETKDQVEGNGNVLSQVHDNSQTTLTDIKKSIDQLQGSAKTTAEQIGEYHQKVVTTNNSTVLMIVLFAISAFINLCFLGAFIFILVKLFKNIGKVRRAIQSEENTLTQEMFDKI